MSKVSQKFADLNITTKIRGGFLLIAIISTLIAINDYFQFKNFETTINSIFTDFVEPSGTIFSLVEDIQNIEKKTLELANPKFAERKNLTLNEINSLRTSINTKFQEIEKKFKSTQYEETVKKLKEKWASYSNNVIDGIISAVNMELYDMAGEIATSLGV